LRSPFLVTSILALAIATAAAAIGQTQTRPFTPVTQDMLVNPSPDDWLMYSRTYDAQRFSPLKQINRQNVGRLQKVWSNELPAGTHQSIPIVHQGVIYFVTPGGTVQALDGANGKLVWEYKREFSNPALASNTKTKTIAMYEDLVFYTAADGYVVALDAQSGKVRWETLAGTAAHTSGPIVVEGKVLTGRACSRTRDSCFIAAHDARTGKEVWKFYTIPAPGEPGSETWGPGGPAPNMMASVWGLPGGYDPARRLVYWGISNPMPNTRMERHNGDPEAIPRTAPADLYSNSTVALDPATGKLSWYYQHLPGDDWDQDYTHERVLLRTAFNPDSKFVKWINPDVPRGQQRDVAVMVGEGGGIWTLDRTTGQFLWATPFPYDIPEFVISSIDPKTGRTTLNWNLVHKKPGEKQTICFFNTKSYWPMAYHPGNNSLYVPYADNCIELTAPGAGQRGGGRNPVMRPGSDPAKFAGIAKVNMATGELRRIYEAAAPGNGAMLATAGDVVFWGDLDRKLRAFDADTGKILWETTLSGAIQNSTITYGANGKQYLAVMTGGLGLVQSNLSREAGIQPATHNEIYVFGLP
jgi:alcohol dehydrogenase (cytochrome c)